MFWYFKMAAKFKMASVVKKCNFLLAVMYLFLGRFEQIRPFWTFYTQLFDIIDKKLKMEPKFNMAYIVKKVCKDYSRIQNQD
jgi:hypothetical protein